MTVRQALAFVRKHGIVLESAKGAVANLGDLVLGAHRAGNWWGHPRAREFFRLTRALRASDDILVCRLVGGKITYVHRRLWPAVARLEVLLGPRRVAALDEVHTRSGKHRVDVVPLSQWLDPSMRKRATAMTEAQARRRVPNVDALLK